MLTWALAPVTESVRLARCTLRSIAGHVPPLRWGWRVLCVFAQLFVCANVCSLLVWLARMLYAVVCIELFRMAEYVHANADKASVVALVTGRPV